MVESFKDKQSMTGERKLASISILTYNALRSSHQKIRRQNSQHKFVIFNQPIFKVSKHNSSQMRRMLYKKWQYLKPNKKRFFLTLTIFCHSNTQRFCFLAIKLNSGGCLNGETPQNDPALLLTGDYFFCWELKFLS